MSANDVLFSWSFLLKFFLIKMRKMSRKKRFTLRNLVGRALILKEYYVLFVFELC